MYYRSQNINDRIIIRYNTDYNHKLLSIDSSGTQTSINTAGIITSDNIMQFINMNDSLYCMN